MKSLLEKINESTFYSKSGESINVPDVTLKGIIEDIDVKEYSKGFFSTYLKINTTDDTKSSNNKIFNKGIYWIEIFKDIKNKLKIGDEVTIDCTVGDFNRLTASDKQIKIVK